MPEINSVAGQLVGIPVGQVYTAGKGIKIDNVNKTVTFDPGTWEDVSTEANYNSNMVSYGGFQIYYNSVLRMVMVSCDAYVLAGEANFFTWTDRLKPIVSSLALGSGVGLYANQTGLTQPSSSAARWVNGVWMWVVKGEN